MFGLRLGRLACIGTTAAFCLMATNVWAQFGGGGAAGIIVDPDGVLRTKVYRDPTGHLTRQRLEAAKANLNPELARPSKMRMVSLTRLERVLAERLARGAGLTEDMKYLAGLTRLQHVFFYPESGDIVIAGPAEGYAHDLSGRALGVVSGRSVLELQDLVVALRAYSPQGRKTHQISVSIDPTQEGLQRMQQFLVQLGNITPNDANRIAHGLRSSLGLQNVSVNGISPKTHFAQVLVEADYRMKLIGIGLEKPPIKMASYVDLANPRDVARNAMQRWFFTPNYDCVKLSDDELAMELVGDGVKLVGENEAVQAGGVRVAGGQVDRASQAFVTGFTAKYGELARRTPVYAQLRNLIDMAIAAAFIQQQDFYSQASWNMEVFGNERVFSVENYTVPETVETAVNVVWKGRTLMTPIGGGVSMVPTKALESHNVTWDEDGQLKKLRQQVTIEGLADDQWWWD